MSEAADIYVLDTSAGLTLIEDEPGADVVQELLEKARAGEIVIVVSFIKDAVKLWRLGRRYKALSAKRSHVFSLVFNVLAND